MTLRIIEDLADLLERNAPDQQKVMALLSQVPADIRPYFHRALTGYQEQTTALFDRHLALCNALEFTLTLRRTPDNPDQWMDEDGTVWTPDPDIAFLIAETQVRAARANKRII